MHSILIAPGSVTATFLAPVEGLIPACENFRSCPELPDPAWIGFGIERVLLELPSGRAFLQEHAFARPHCPPRENYFASLRSPRRLALAEELNRRLCSQAVDTLPDALANYPELEEFDLYAGDGHWHGAAAHDARIDETKWAVGHFYARVYNDNYSSPWEE